MYQGYASRYVVQFKFKLNQTSNFKLITYQYFSFVVNLFDDTHTPSRELRRHFLATCDTSRVFRVLVVFVAFSEGKRRTLVQVSGSFLWWHTCGHWTKAFHALSASLLLLQLPKTQDYFWKNWSACSERPLPAQSTLHGIAGWQKPY